MSSRIITILALVLVTISTSLRADVTVEDYKKFTKNRKSMDFAAVQNYVSGLGAGAMWSSKTFNEIYGVPLYCAPDESAATAENYMAILDKTIRKYESGTKDIIGSILVIGLIETYPCK